KFREKVMKMIEKKKEKEVINYLKKEYLANENVAKNVYNYLKLELEFLRKYGIKNLPSNKTILIENVIENNYQHIIFHTLFGRRINDALSRAYGYALMKKVGKGIGIAINDNGFVLSIPLEEKGWILIKPKPLIDSKEVIKLVNSKNFEDLLKKSLINTELLKRKFRHVATRSLMILRNYKGHEISIEKQQINAEKLIKIVKNLERFPVLEETYREILEDFMDVKNSKKILEDIEKGKIKFEFLPILDVPSPFAHNLFALSESDVVLMEDRKKLLLELYKKVTEKIEKKI
ncbi:MAG: ATP-dependent helicase, partial [Candidatus Aenigmatarchaeota archaeon]